MMISRLLEVDFWRLVTGKIEAHVCNMLGTFGLHQLLQMHAKKFRLSQTSAAEFVKLKENCWNNL